MKPIDSLTPEELRVECAEAMGWTRCVGGCQPKGETTPRYWRDSKGREFRYPPNYPADANAALTLADALAGWKMDVHMHGLEIWNCVFIFPKDSVVKQATATGPHAFPLAVSRAYLAVIRSTKNAQ